jgi:alkyl sulfatase BDS1-like metallo-beta-lactamase superfamily hydrolase
VVAVIYSHGHLDHVGGVRAFVPEGADASIPIYANTRWPAYRTYQAIPAAPIRGLYQMGLMLPAGPEGVVGNGAGPAYRAGVSNYIVPTHLVDESLDVELAGVKLRLFHAPGDVDDGLAAWLPEQGVLLAGDAYYSMFPALSTPRFDRHRDAWKNLETLDKFRALGATHMVPGHLGVVSGRERVAERLTAFRDAIQFMHDQTLRLMNQGLGQTEVANAVRANFPAHLASDPNLVEYYQRLEWVVKGIYAKNGGWYGGDVVELVQIGPDERAQKLVALAGGREAMRAEAQRAYEGGERAWAAELARHLLRADPGDAASRALFANVLRAIGYDARSANLRNYMLTEALVVEGVFDPRTLKGLGRVGPDLLRPVADSVLFKRLGVYLNPAKSTDVAMTSGFTLRDTGAEHTLFVRRGVIEYRAGRPAKADLRVEFDRETWLAIAGRNLAWSNALQGGLLEASSESSLSAFAALFD